MVAWVRSLLLGWVTLLLLAYAIEWPMLRWAGPFIGANWIATVHLCFDAATLAGAGYAASRGNPSHAVLSSLLLLATLSFWDFGEALALNVPWLVRLMWNSFHDVRYLESLAATAETDALLSGCLIAGAWMARPREKVVSIVGK